MNKSVLLSVFFAVIIFLIAANVVFHPFVFRSADSAFSSKASANISDQVASTTLPTQSIPAGSTKAVEPKARTVSAAVEASEKKEAISFPNNPARLIIPSIGLDAPIQNMGLTSAGNLDVPPGQEEVGWWQGGTVPGDLGSAVMDADVLRAFSQLKNVKEGDDMYVLRRDGLKLHFSVSEMNEYPIENVPLETLFNRADGIRLNLITCSGKLTPDGSTFDHRLIVFAKLAN